ncbi:M20 family metallopeptidase [Nocardiopsis sp. CC223A]|uniref:M20 family metallopeptidase n=1 Tax=Nocardiopsis sp. CC223A TaxID=3044051 RepID=UPI00278C8DEB|nr:M20/M25/M40 family metallo-hydrolase [Nocardiopsis sp. CC223A]
MNASSLSVLERARADLDSVLDLTRDLVRIPTRGGIDPYDDAIDLLTTWLGERDLSPQVLREGTGAPVGVTARVRGGRPGPTWVLDACLDTAPVGDTTAWKYDPFAAVLEDGWLWGRGAADSKSGVAIFSHLAAHLVGDAENLAGDLAVLFDLDEHTGGFGGAKAFFEGPDAPDQVGGVMIGYPGMDKLVIGGRGVYRVRLHVHGIAGHSGGSRPTPSAISKAADLVRALEAEPLPEAADGFAAGRLTVTAITAGNGFSVVPDLCTLNVDVRTTPTFTNEHAVDLVTDVVAKVDADWADTAPTLIEARTRWPAYALASDAPLRTALLDAARAHGIPVQAKIAGPSNIGNYLAGLGIPATAGFGAVHEGLHAANERIRVDTVPVVQAVYEDAVRTLMG